MWKAFFKLNFVYNDKKNIGLDQNRVGPDRVWPKDEYIATVSIRL